jgi:hypothetical protein
MPTGAKFTNATGARLADNINIQTAGPRGPALLQGICLIEKLAHFDHEVIPERLQMLRRRRRPLLRDLEQARRSTLPDHVYRPSQLGPWVPISKSCYKADAPAR